MINITNYPTNVQSREANSSNYKETVETFHMWAERYLSETELNLKEKKRKRRKYCFEFIQTRSIV